MPGQQIGGVADGLAVSPYGWCAALVRPAAGGDTHGADGGRAKPAAGLADARGW